MNSDERAIRAVIDDWLQATRDHDDEKILDLMTDDVVFMVAGEEPFGKEEFAATLEGMKDVRIEGRSEVLELQLLGDWAFVRTYLELNVSTGVEGAPASRSGHTMTLFRKEADGRWRLARDANFVT